VNVSAAGQPPGDRRPGLRSALWAAPRAVGRYLLAGLGLLGYSTAAAWPPVVPEPVRPPDAEPPGEPVLSSPMFSSPVLSSPVLPSPVLPPPVLPPGHPERLVPHLAPSRTERRLWAQLRHGEDG
jgi:hypothetical protein